MQQPVAAYLYDGREIGDVAVRLGHQLPIDVVTLLLDTGADIEADEINCYDGNPLSQARA